MEEENTRGWNLVRKKFEVVKDSVIQTNAF